MKKYVVNTVLFLSLASMLSGCVSSPFIPKALNDNAKGITTSKSTPYGCKFLGEVEGADGYNRSTYYPLVPEARLGALNDLRNNAKDVVGQNNKRITLRIIEEKPVCVFGDSCLDKKNIYSPVSSYTVVAQIFECGDK